MIGFEYFFRACDVQISDVLLHANNHCGRKTYPSMFRCFTNPTDPDTRYKWDTIMVTIIGDE